MNTKANSTYQIKWLDVRERDRESERANRILMLYFILMYSAYVYYPLFNLLAAPLFTQCVYCVRRNCVCIYVSNIMHLTDLVFKNRLVQTFILRLGTYEHKQRKKRDSK